MMIVHPAHGFISGLIAADLASGAYFYQMKSGESVAAKKFVVIK